MQFIKSPIGLMIIALILLLLGVVMPFLMMMQLLQSTLLLNFLAYAASTGGLVLGIVAVSLYWRPEDKEDDYSEY
jgi:membrane associated rhomboid family serine protease